MSQYSNDSPWVFEMPDQPVTDPYTQNQQYQQYQQPPQMQHQQYPQYPQSMPPQTQMSDQYPPSPNQSYYPQPPHMPPQVAPIGANALMFAADPMMAAAMTSGQNFVSTSNSWIDNNLRPYFAVDDKYVILKLSYLIFPFKRWQSSVAKPDLYIPMMSFITYVLSAGYLLGVQNQFTPEKLGIISSSALFCVGFEVILMAILFSVSNAGLPFGYCVAFSGYKFVPIIWAIIISLFFKSTGYYITIAYSTLSLGYYLVRSCHMATVENAKDEENRKGLYLSTIFCLLQPLIMFWLSYHLVSGLF